jgi:hypothetical protein
LTNIAQIVGWQIIMCKHVERRKSRP